MLNQTPPALNPSREILKIDYPNRWNPTPFWNRTPFDLMRQQAFLAAHLQTRECFLTINKIS